MMVAWGWCGTGSRLSAMVLGVRFPPGGPESNLKVAVWRLFEWLSAGLCFPQIMAFTFALKDDKLILWHRGIVRFVEQYFIQNPVT